MRQPDFQQLLKVLRREVPDRPTLFEFFLNRPLLARACGEKGAPGDPEREAQLLVRGFHALGYDYATLNGQGFSFPAGPVHQDASRSMNEGALITDRASFAQYPWPVVDDADYRNLGRAAAWLPAGMKVIASGPGGVLENLTALVGYDNLCFMLADDPGLVAEIVGQIGSRLVRHYQICGSFPAVGAMISNDDWGFKTQTMLAPDQMREYIIPWHRQICAAIHAAGRPAILHSCGNLETVMDDIIDDIGYDAKHSYEDNIQPVEEAYEQYGRRIAILGGLDLDFVCRSTPAQVQGRAQQMLERTATRGSYGLGTGNSVPEYVPHENYLAMIRAAVPEVVLPG